jgi:hypothetical protein
MDYTTSQLIKEAVAQYDNEVRETQYKSRHSTMYGNDSSLSQHDGWKDYDVLNESRRRGDEYYRLAGRWHKSQIVHDFDAEADAAQSRRKPLEKSKHDPIWGINGKVARLKARRRKQSVLK